MGNAHLRIRQLTVDDLSPADVAAWIDLESRALEPSAYLSPLFLVPALRHLSPHARTRIYFLEDQGCSDHRLRAVVVLQPRWFSRTLPLFHMQAYHSTYAFQTGILVDRETARESLVALAHELLRGHGGMAFEYCHTDGPTDRLLREIAGDVGMSRCEIDAYPRATMRPRELGDAFLASKLSRRNKQLNQKKRKLGNLGPVEFKLHRGAGVDAAVLDRHLELEHKSWKGSAGTSMRAVPEHEAFFKEMASGFAAANRAMFAELSVGGRVIASSSNFTAGKSGFAFRIGTDPEFREFSPGIMCEWELMRCAPVELAHLDSVDGGCTAGSYLEELWPERNVMASVGYASSFLGMAGMRTVDYVRRARRTLKRPAAA